MPTDNNGPSKGNKMFITKAPFRWRVFKKLRADSELTLSNPWSQVRKVWFHSVLYGCRKGRGGKLGSLQFCLSEDKQRKRYVTMTHNNIMKNHLGRGI